MPIIGILLTNTGTPDAPTPQAVKKYLREFLSDPRIVQLPRFLWLPILHTLVLPIRPKHSAKLYQQIWTNDGSPMRIIMKKIATRLEHAFVKEKNLDVHVEIGMNYGNPSIAQGLENLKQKNVDKILVLPLFPQFSNATTSSSFDKIKKINSSTELCFIEQYSHHHEYVAALANSLGETWAKEGKAQHLLISFHGIPKRYVRAGDPYATHCETTANLLAKKLQLNAEEWSLCYQSRFGYAAWLQPSTQVLFETLPKRQIKNIDVICPGFAVDCLETLEEIAIRGKASFLKAGGDSLRYIPALNDAPSQINLLMKIVESKL